MPVFSPIVVALAIVSALGFIGAIVGFARRNAMFHGYRDIAKDAKAITKLVKGEVFRDGEDLVIAGNFNRMPVTVRFSYQENTPGLNMRMEVPSTFMLSAVPAGTPNPEGRSPVRTGVPQFDSRFSLRSDHPTQVQMFLGSRAVMGEFSKLCCGSKTFVALSKGSIELSELAVPEPYTGRHVMEHVREMGRLGLALGQMPGAESIKIQPIQRDRMLVARAAMAVGMVAAVATVVTGVRARNTPVTVQVEQGVPAGITPAEANMIPGVDKFRLATTDDFDGAAVTWMRNNGQTASGRVTGDFSGLNDGRDEALILRGPDGSFRVTVLISGERRSDLSYPELAAAARLPKSRLETVQWSGDPPENPDSDGLLLLVKSGDKITPVVLFSKGDKMISAAPANYLNLNL
jgi:hypothetical protein